MRQTILVTGSNGFIGSHLTSMLMSFGYNVIGIDINETIPDIISDNKILAHVDDSGCYEFLKGDVVEVLNENPKIGSRIDFIYHLASPIGVDYAINRPADMLVKGNLINFAVYNLAQEYDIPVVYSSSSEVFGSGSNSFEMNLPDSTEYNTRSSYALMKVSGELLFSTLKKHVTVRFFNIIGYGQKTKSNIIPAINNSFETGEPFVIRSENTRSYCSIYTCVEVLYKTLLYWGDVQGGTINISNPEASCTPKDMYLKIAKLKGIEPNYKIEIDQSDTIGDRIPQSNINTYFRGIEKLSIDDLLVSIYI